MSITFFIQWYQWVLPRNLNWQDFDIISISFERDKVAMDSSVTIVLLGFGFHIHYISKNSKEVWQKLMESDIDVKKERE